MSITVTHQCIYMKKNGQRCRKRTRYPDYCAIHMPMAHHLTIGKSMIPNSGQGLFATIHLPKRTEIPFYGTFLSQPLLPHNGYTIDIKKHPPTFLDSSESHSCYARYANVCRRSDQRSGLCPGNNAEIIVDRSKLSAKLRLTQNVRPGQEIFSSYGSSFW